ncbi:MAG: hypothetical protein PHT07_21615 [Paludibacter sp.]|nr:hypothetical protein [Paludibacter sp.]
MKAKDLIALLQQQADPEMEVTFCTPSPGGTNGSEIPKDYIPIEFKITSGHVEEIAMQGSSRNGEKTFVLTDDTE